MTERIAKVTLLLIAAAGCDDGISPTSVAWAWAGPTRTCATTYDRRFWCWGTGVGDGTDQARDVPTRPSGDLKDVGFAAGTLADTCVVRTGRLLCWGPNSGGDGGILTATPAAAPTLQAVMPDLVANVGCTPLSKCVVKMDGSAWCWGFGSDGSLGDGMNADSAVPVPVSSLSAGVLVVLASHQGMYALKGDGTVWGWDAAIGAMVSIQRPPGGSSVPVPIVRSDGAPLMGIRQIDGGGDLTCALGFDSRVVCWGIVEPNQPGVDYAVDLDVGDTAASIIEIAVGWGAVCRLDGAGVVQCMGTNDYGQLGNDEPAGYRPTMAPVVGLPGPAVHILAGDQHFCALTEDRTLWCWGENVAGQLGVGDTDGRSHPTEVRFAE